MNPPTTQLFQLETIYERDIDLLLMEELTVNTAFRKNLFERFFGCKIKNHHLMSVTHSVTDSELGESDIEVIITAEIGRLALLVENKIDAVFQPEQASRYFQRGEKRKGDVFTDYRVCLVAPAAYLSGADEAEWPCRLSYEEIGQYLSHDIPPERQAFKNGLLQLSAAKKASRESIPDKAVTDFWNGYYDLLDEHFPDLRLKGGKKQRPANSGWGMLSKEGWPSTAFIYLKLSEGKIDLTFNNRQAVDLESRLKGLLGDGMSIEQTGKSAVVRLRVSPVIPGAGLTDQAYNTFATMIAADRLARLYPKFVDALNSSL